MWLGDTNALQSNNNKLIIKSMTKKDFSKLIFNVVQNLIEEQKSDNEIIDDIEILIDTLEPRDRESFSKWGNPNQRTTENKCWA